MKLAQMICPRTVLGCFFLFIFSSAISAANLPIYDCKNYIIEPSFNMYIQGDSITFRGDTEDLINNQENLRSGVNSPRARFIVRGKYFDLRYMLAYDAAENRVREAFVRDEKHNKFYLTVGQFKAPYNFWFLLSQSQFNFLEQSLPTIALGLGFRAGILAQYFMNPLTFSASIIGPELDNTLHGEPVNGSTPLAVNSRITLVPIRTDNLVLHFAGAVVFQDSDSSHRFKFAAVPEVQTYHNHTLVNTGFMEQSKSYLGHEFESIAIYGPLTVGSEFYQTHVYRSLEDVTFGGFEVMVDYFLTGEHYLYSFKDGAIQGVSDIKHCYGAWQLLARYSHLNLQDGPIKGGREDNTTIGINWTANKTWKFLLNYIYVRTYPSENGLNRHVNILGLRCQLSA